MTSSSEVSALHSELAKLQEHWLAMSKAAPGAPSTHPPTHTAQTRPSFPTHFYPHSHSLVGAEGAQGRGWCGPQAADAGCGGSPVPPDPHATHPCRCVYRCDWGCAMHNAQAKLSQARTHYKSTHTTPRDTPRVGTPPGEGSTTPRAAMVSAPGLHTLWGSNCAVCLSGVLLLHSHHQRQCRRPPQINWGRLPCMSARGVPVAALVAPVCLPTQGTHTGTHTGAHTA